MVYRYRRCQCRRTFRHYPAGITHARQSQRLVHFAALCWLLGLSLRGTSAILSVAFAKRMLKQPAARVAVSGGPLAHERLARRAGPGRHPETPLALPGAGIGDRWGYPKLRGQEQPTLVCVDLGSGQPVALGAIPEKDWRAVVAWLKPLVAAWGVEGNCEAIPKALLCNARAGQ